MIEERGYMILNGCIDGDSEYEYTYTGGRGETVIDYVLGNEKIIEDVRKVEVGIEVGEEVDSDLYPVVVKLDGEVERKMEGEKNSRIGKMWDERGREKLEK